MTELEAKVINEKIEFINDFKKWFVAETSIDDIEYKLYQPLDEVRYQEHVIIHKNGGTRSIDVTGNSTWAIAIDIINAICM